MEMEAVAGVLGDCVGMLRLGAVCGLSLVPWASLNTDRYFVFLIIIM
jgi:hypothetical protein